MSDRGSPRWFLQGLRAVGWLLLLSACACAWSAPAARDEPLQITELQVERADDGYYLTAQLGFDLPNTVQDALAKGMPLYFVADAQLLRERWYWRDKPVASVTRYLRLAYQPLTRRWRFNLSSEPWGSGASAAASLSQHFDSLPEALGAMRHLGRWKLADAHVLQPEARHYVLLHVWLDASQLPRPFQMGVVGQDDWDLDATRKFRLEPGK